MEAETEQITAQPVEEKPVKVEDRRRVAAGKALAARNKAMREAKKQQVEESTTFVGVLEVAAVVGAGFTLYHGYQVVKPYFTNKKSYVIPVHTVVKDEPKEKNEIKGIDME